MGKRSRYKNNTKSEGNTIQFHGTNWAGSGGEGYNYKTFKPKVVEDGVIEEKNAVNLRKVQLVADKIKQEGFDLVRVGWTHANVCTQ